MKNLFNWIGALIGLAVFLAVNVLSNTQLSNVRADFTENQLFTLSEGSKTIASKLEEPIHLYFYYSKEAGKEFPPVVAYHERVLNVLESYVRHADGKLILEERNPESYSEAEEQAAGHGITGIPVGAEALYFGLSASNAVDDNEVIPFFGDLSGGGFGFDKKERFLEYDISRLIYSLANPIKPRVAFLSALPLEGTPGNPQTRQPGAPPWRVISEMRRFFDVDVLPLSTESIAVRQIEDKNKGYDALVLIQPRQLSETLLYGIDQFVMRGGKLVAFVDPHCELDQSAQDPSNPMGNMGASKESELNQLFGAWGFETVAHTFIGDEENCLKMPLVQGDPPLNMVAYLNLTGDRLNKEDPITSQLDTLRMFIAGQVKATEDASTSFEPLITSGSRAMTMDSSRVQMQPDFLAMLQGFVPGAEELVIGARISGDTKSAYADGNPMPNPGGEDEQEHLAQSDGPINVIVVTDADMLYDALWLQERKMGQFSLGFSIVSSNCDFLTNALGNLTGGDDLISIRARGQFSRPFERVKKIRDQADKVFLDEEKKLTGLLEQAQSELDALLAQQAPQDAGGGQLLISPEVQNRIDTFREDKVKHGRNLRRVKHERNKDIDALGFKLKLANIVGMPALVILLGIILSLSRQARRKG
jgi:ABC-type uncharacterized transport system involved in gliding motility auxiliary subunit